MTGDKKMLRLSLQFFGGGGEGAEDDPVEDDGGAYDDFDDDFDDDFFDDDEEYEDSDYGEEEAENAAQNTDNVTQDANEDADRETGKKSEEATSSSTASASHSPSGKADDLISELRALGYVGNDLAALTADIRQKREAKAEQDAKAEGIAVRVAGKSHLKAGRPGKRASGDGTGGIDERQVNRFVETTGSSKEQARAILAKHARLIEG